MENIIKHNKFELINAYPFNEIQRSLDPFDWNVSFVAKKAGN